MHPWRKGNGGAHFCIESEDGLPFRGCKSGAGSHGLQIRSRFSSRHIITTLTSFDSIFLFYFHSSNNLLFLEWMCFLFSFFGIFLLFLKRIFGIYFWGMSIDSICWSLKKKRSRQAIIAQQQLDDATGSGISS